MCTFTAIRVVHRARENSSVRICFNRDELRSRSPAEPPRIFGNSSEFIMPIDSQSGGTWIGVNSSGLFFALLNVYEANSENVSENHRGESRGIIIPELLLCRGIDCMEKKIKRMDYDLFQGFRLIFLDINSMFFGNIRWNQKILTRQNESWNGKPVFFTSSGLGDQYVYEPRKKLFYEYFSGFDASERYYEIQDRFHLDRMRGREDRGILMEREKALTVSRSVVEIQQDQIRFLYFTPPDSASPEIVRMIRK